MVNLHYAKLNLQGDIPCLQFDSIQILGRHLFELVEKECVFVFSYNLNDPEISDEVLITDDVFYINQFLKHNAEEFSLNGIEDYFFQVYPSYEEAYKAALSMKETSPLCYNK